MNFSDILTRFRGVKKEREGQFMAFCPAHADGQKSGRASLAIGTGENGAVTVSCFAGCETADVLGAVGLKLADLFPDKPKSKHRKRKQRPLEAELVARWTYHNAAGQPVFDIARFEWMEGDTLQKDYAQFRIGGGKVKDMDADDRWILYRLPDVLVASENAERVLVVEGEKCADALAELGILATTLPGGAGKWRRQYLEQLSGARVVVLPDNDPGGKKHARKIASQFPGAKLLDLDGLGPKGDVYDWIAQRRAQNRTVGEIRAELLDLVSACPVLKAVEADRPKILITDRQLDELYTDARTAIRAWNDARLQKRNLDGLSPLFLRLGLAVYLHVDRDRPPTVAQLSATQAHGYLARCITWKKERERDAWEVAAKPPGEIAADLVALPDRAWPYLDEVAHAPVFGRTGQLVSEPGYDPGEAVWYAQPSALESLPPVPNLPTPDDLREAVRLLDEEMLVDFPFARPSDKAHMIGALVLPFVRRMIRGPVPFQLIEAPAPGSGKSLLADLVAVLRTGGRASVAVLPKLDDDIRKLVTTKLLEAQPVIVIDNIPDTGVLDSPTLAALATSVEWTDRILGESRSATVDNRASWLLTANNPTLTAELVRRVVRIRIDAGVARPELRRSFKHEDVVQWATDNRAQLVWAVLVLVRHWVARGKPTFDYALASFNAWAGVIGGIVRCAGFEGFLENRDELTERADPEAEEWVRLLTAWWNGRPPSMKPEWKTAGQVVRMADLEKVSVSRLTGNGSDRSRATKMGSALRKAVDGRLFVVGFGHASHTVHIVRDSSNSAAITYRPELVATAEPSEPTSQGSAAESWWNH